jgi:hypothetical protein
MFFFFLFCKIGEQKNRTGPAWEGGLAPVGEGGDEERGRRVNMV